MAHFVTADCCFQSTVLEGNGTAPVDFAFPALGHRLKNVMISAKGRVFVDITLGVIGDGYSIGVSVASRCSANVMHLMVVL